MGSPVSAEQNLELDKQILDAAESAASQLANAQKQRKKSASNLPKKMKS